MSKGKRKQESQQAHKNKYKPGTMGKKQQLKARGSWNANKPVKKKEENEPVYQDRFPEEIPKYTPRTVKWFGRTDENYSPRPQSLEQTAKNETLPLISNLGLQLELQGVYFLNNVYYIEQGFSPREVRQITPQIKRYVERSKALGTNQHVLVEADNKMFYVHVDGRGHIKLPQIKSTKLNPQYGKTNKQDEIVAYKSAIETLP